MASIICLLSTSLSTPNETVRTCTGSYFKYLAGLALFPFVYSVMTTEYYITLHTSSCNTLVPSSTDRQFEFDRARRAAKTMKMIVYGSSRLSWDICSHTNLIDRFQPKVWSDVVPCFIPYASLSAIRPQI